MSRRFPPDRSHEEEEPASPEGSRLLVIGFLIAGLLGLMSGLAWMGCQLVRNHLGS
jgi:hypothetical protein